MRIRIPFILKIYLAALIFRLIPVLLTPSLGIGLDDMFQYDMLARSLASGNGYRWYAYEDLQYYEPYIDFDLTSVEYDHERGVPTSFRPPLYPAFLALVYTLVGSGPQRFFVVRLLQAFIGAGIAPLTYVFASSVLNPQFSTQQESADREVVAGSQIRRASRWAAWVVACYPMLVLYPLSLATENLFFVLVLGSLLVVLRALQSRSGVNFLLCGLLFGLTALTRSVILAVAGLCILWIWFGLRERKGALLMFLSLSIVVSPWIIRNSLLHGRLTGIESSLGYSLYAGYHPQGTGTFQFGPSLDLVPILDDSLRDQVGTRAALQFIRDDPARVPYLALRKLGHFFGLERRAVMYFYSNNFLGYLPAPVLLVSALILWMPFVLLALSACLGLALMRWNQSAQLLGIVTLGYLVPHVIIQAEERFHLTLVPVFAVLAARVWMGGYRAVRDRWRQSVKGRLALSAGGAGVILLVLNWSLELVRNADRLAVLLGPAGNHSYFPY